MDPSATPPPLPGRASIRLSWILLGVAALVVVGVAVFGAIIAFQRIQARAAAARAALGDLQREADSIRDRTAADLAEGKTDNSDEALGKLKDVVGKAASQMTGADADVARAMNAFLGEMQAEMRNYNEAANRLTETNLFEFDLADRSAIEPQREVARSFLAANERLSQFSANASQRVMAELERAKVPARIREATLKGFEASQVRIRPVQQEIRRCDKVLGDSALAILDLLDQQWGKWKRDPASGQIQFADETTRQAYSQLTEAVQTAAAEQALAQQELAEKMRAPQPR